VGGVSGVILANAGVDTAFHDTMYVVAHLCEGTVFLKGKLRGLILTKKANKQSCGKNYIKNALFKEARQKFRVVKSSKTRRQYTICDGG